MVSYYPSSQYKFKEFQKSTRKGKKYMALLQNKKTKKITKVHFGDSSMAQYKDTTGLGLYSKKDHLDPKRKKSYRERHQKYAKRKYSPSYFSYNFLW